MGGEAVTNIAAAVFSRILFLVPQGTPWVGGFLGQLPAPAGDQEPCWWAVLCLSLVVWHEENEAECPQSNYLCSSWLLRMRVLLRVEVLSSPQNTSLTFL